MVRQARAVSIRLLMETRGAHFDDAALHEPAASMGKVRAAIS